MYDGYNVRRASDLATVAWFADANDAHTWAKVAEQTDHRAYWVEPRVREAVGA